MKSAGKARSNGLYRHIRTSKEIIRNLLNDSKKYIAAHLDFCYDDFTNQIKHMTELFESKSKIH